MIRTVTRAKNLIQRPLASVNWRFMRAAGGNERPAFYDVDKTYPAFRLIDQGYPVIRKEVEALINQKENIPRYHDLARSESYVSGSGDAEKSWRVFMLMSAAGTPTANQARCPHTTALLKKIPNVYQAFFSILDPRKSIPAHSGTYYGYLRYHLGLRVPKNNPPTMRVKDQFHTWEEGRSILFDDSWNHEVINTSDEIRVVLIVDVLRPMPLPLHAANWVISNLLMPRSEEAKLVLANIKKFS